MSWMRIGLAGALLGLAALPACLGSPEPAPPDPLRYRLRDSGASWADAEGGQLLAELLPRYPDFFAVVLDPDRGEEPRLLPLREDLEREPTDRRNYDALNAVAIAYFEINHRGELQRGELGFLSQGFRAAKLAAVPWRAYREIHSGPLRDAILDFFADVASGQKLGTPRTAPRLTGIVESLAANEDDDRRRARIDAIARQLGEAAGTR